MRSIILDRKIIHEDPEKFDKLINISRLSLSNLSWFYPCFNTWYSEKVIPGMYTGERTIIIYFSNKNVAGISILKTSSYEKKLCCLRVAQDFHGSGVGLRLFSDSFNYLETEKPLLSVSEEKVPIFKRIFDHFKFEIGNEYRDLYRIKKAEFSFNGLLKAEPLIKR